MNKLDKVLATLRLAQEQAQEVYDEVSTEPGHPEPLIIWMTDLRNLVEDLGDEVMIFEEFQG